VVSECSEGVGSEEYADAQRRLIWQGPDEFYRSISAKNFAAIDEWQTQMQLKPMRVGSVHLYSGALSSAERGLTGVNMVDSVDAALRRCVEESGDDAVAVIPEGPYVVPVYQSAA
jgi:hypothetical protein